MEKFERVAKKGAYYTSVFMEKYAGLLKDMLKANGYSSSELDATFDEMIGSFQGDFRKVLAQKLAQRYQADFEAKKADQSCFDIINGGAFDSENPEENLSLIEQCLDECGYDKSILDLRLLSGVRVSAIPDYFMNDLEFYIENINQGTYDSTWYETVYPSEVIEFGTTPDEARFKDEGAYRPIEDVMAEGLEIAKKFHNSYIDNIKSRLANVQQAIEEASKNLSITLAKINVYKENARIVPSSLYKSEELEESCLGRFREYSKKLEEQLKALEENSNITYDGGKYHYAFASTLTRTTTEPGND